MSWLSSEAPRYFSSLLEALSLILGEGAKDLGTEAHGSHVATSLAPLKILLLQAPVWID